MNLLGLASCLYAQCGHKDFYPHFAAWNQHLTAKPTIFLKSCYNKRKAFWLLYLSLNKVYRNGAIAFLLQGLEGLHDQESFIRFSHSTQDAFIAFHRETPAGLV